MPSAFQPKTFVVAIALVAACAAQAVAQERCEGTLCDLYYGDAAPSGTPSQPAAKPTAPTPLMAPTGPGYLRNMFSSGSSQQTAGQAATGPTLPSRIQVQGGGLAALARGEKTERCSGTLCDLYYGSPAPEPEEQAAAAAAPVSQDAVSQDAAVPTPDAMDERTRERIRFRQAEVEEAAKPRCNSTAADPWKCYR